MRQLVKLLPLNERQLEEAIRQEMEENPFLSFSTASNNAIDMDSFSDNQSASIYKIIQPQIDAIFSGEEHAIAMYFLEHLDDDGFMREYTNPYDSNGIKVLEKLHTLEPSGVFSRNLPEFYYTYLKREGKLTPLWEKFLSNIEKIATGDMKSALNSMGSNDIVQAFLQDLKILPTSPNIDKSTASIITPDVIATDNEDIFSLRLSSVLHKNITIDESYVNDVRKHYLKSQDKKFITEKFTIAKWLKSALQMRADTLLNISELLVDHQKSYLKGGDLKPLSMKEIAEKSGVHISTVSRIANNKYIQTPIATLAFKSFFTPNSKDGISQNTIIKMIATLIKNEKKNDIVLSDEKIVHILKSKNVNIARRTVMKYRDKLGIPSSHIRKKYHNKG